MPNRTKSHETAHIAIHHIGVSPSGLTAIYRVDNPDESVVLGHIKWYGPWRKYCFYPDAKTLFCQACLGEISNQLHTLTKSHREKGRS